MLKLIGFLTGLFALILSSAQAGEGPLKLLVMYAQSSTPVRHYVAAEDVRGVMIALDEINGRGGLMGRRVELVDGHITTEAEARQLALEYAAMDDLLAVVGANTSNATLMIAPVFHEHRIPIISPIATNPQVTLTGDYVFRACFTDPFQGKVMARYALEDLGADTAVILTKASSKFSVGLTEHFKKEFEKGGTVLWEGSYLFGDVDFSEILARVRELNPDVVFVPGHGQDSGLVLKQARAMGIGATFLGGDGWGKGVLGVAGAEAVEGHAFSNHWHMDVDTPLSKKFVQAYHGKFGPGLIAASAPLAYDAAMLIASAVKRAGTADREKVRDALALTRDAEGVTGHFTFDANGDPKDKDAVILKYRNGEIVFVKSIQP